ncbi:dihydrofolate reductase [Candidatus Saccharibacteria bacterium]|nr:dihydrofolate reductase [Candidatus Saccharibacteria bacterium]
MISAIVAVAENGVIGKAGKIPWKIPADWAYFKNTTIGHPIIMGKATYEGIGKPLPDRKNIVVSNTEGYKAEDCTVVNSLPEAIKAAGGNKEIFIIGGASVYEQAMPMVDRLYLTKVHANPEGDRFFKYNEDDWLEISKEGHRADEKNQYDYDYIVLERRRS